MDGYRRGLNGKQAAWASKKYRGHRVLPESIMQELDKAAIIQLYTYIFSKITIILKASTHDLRGFQFSKSIFWLTLTL
jgi:hypothetical protein